MKRTKWLIDYRNKLSSLVMEVDSCAAKNAQITNPERNHIKNSLRDIVNYIDKQLF